MNKTLKNRLKIIFLFNKSIEKYFLIFLIILSHSCANEPVETIFFDFSNNKGVFVANEGNFMYGNSSLSFYDSENKRVYNQIFQARNGIPLGDVAHSVSIWKEKAYIVVNNSGKIYVIDNSSAKYISTITRLTSPRYIHFINDQKAYISDLYAKKITVFNPESSKIIKTISTANSRTDLQQHSTEQMIQYKNMVYTNCWSYDNKILVINTDTDSLIDSIEVINQPNSIILDRFNKLWVLCDGGFEGNKLGNELAALIKIDIESKEIERIFRFTTGERPHELKISNSKDTLLFINKHIWKMSTNDKRLPDKPFIVSQNTSNYGGFYSIGIDPSNADIYIGDAIDHRQNGLIRRYNKSGVLIDEFKVGISPGNFAFKN